MCTMHVHYACALCMCTSQQQQSTTLQNPTSLLQRFLDVSIQAPHRREQSVLRSTGVRLYSRCLTSYFDCIYE